MRSKYAFPADRFDVLSVEHLTARRLRLLVKQRHRQQPGVTLIHVEPSDGPVPERPKHSYPADPENDFLANPIVAIAAVERIS